ncbi:MAG: hypothetical protein V5B32_15050 [Candidatus Accumulibacter sp. UW26]|jgi:hypothetical protein
MTCCSSASFVPAPDAALDSGQRVNFTFGMVLGVDDFRQEHRYLAARDEHLLRQLIGYGVSSGLDVVAIVDPIDPTKVELRVAPGVALLPDGKLVGVRQEQCASLDGWLAGPNSKDASGTFPVYVVLRAAERSGTPVPIPGEPCRDESALQADSRIADSFSLDFTWNVPASHEDDALRSFAAWLRQIPVHAEPLPVPELAGFEKAVEDAVGAAIVAGWPSSIAPPLAVTPQPAVAADLVIPHARYAEFINAAFAVWTRRLRGRYLARHGPVPAAEEGAESGLLLAAIDCTLSAGQLSALGEVRLLGRPQLIHQRLLQEWLLDRPDDAPRDAHYVLGRSDPRLPNAQDLHAVFTDAPRRMVCVARENGDGVLRPAVLWPGEAPDQQPADYYGPQMPSPIPVHDGGTGQSTSPEPGQLLVGAPVASPAAEPAFVLGNLQGALHDGVDGTQVANIVVDPASQAPNLLLDTAQDIDAGASPTFAGLTVDGELDAGSLSLTNGADIGGTLTVAGATTFDGLFTANGGITASSLALPTLASAIVAAAADGQLIPATRWDGDEGNLAGNATYYYAPAQGHAVRIADGGTGLTDAPARGQLLIGNELAGFTLGSLVGADGERNVTVAATATGLGVDTVQDLHVAAEPTFAGLFLTDLPDLPATHALGWHSEKRAVVLTGRQANGRQVHVFATPDDFLKAIEQFRELGAADQVLVYGNDKALRSAVPAPRGDGQMLIIKTLPNAGSIILESGLLDVGFIGLEAGQSVTLIASVVLERWLLIGRS